MKQKFLKCLFWNKFLVLSYKGIQQSIKRSAIKISLYWVQFIIVFLRSFLLASSFSSFRSSFLQWFSFRAVYFPSTFCCSSFRQQFSKIFHLFLCFFLLPTLIVYRRAWKEGETTLIHQYQFQPLLLNINTMIGQLLWRVLPIPASLV